MPRLNLPPALWRSYLTQIDQRNQSVRTERLRNAGLLSAWRRWKADEEVMNQIPIVRRIARTESRKFAAHLDMRDLVQSGMVGLMEAKRRYRPGKGGGFAQFAYFRIRGAIIDANKRKAYRETTHSSLSAEIHDPDRSGSLRRKPMTIADTVASPQPAADEMMERKQQTETLLRAIGALQPPDRLLLRAWMEGKSIREQCAISGMSQNYTRDRVTQIQARLRGLVAA